MNKASDIEQDDDIDLRELFIRLGRGLGQMIGLGLLGLVIFVLGNIFITWRQPVVTTCRVVFTFSGLERGEYPDHSKFSADDLRAPNIIAEVLKEQGLDTNDNFQSRIRAAIDVEGVMPDTPQKARDTLRPGDSSAYIPDEYIVMLTLPRHFPLNNQQRESLLNGIINVYRENFWRTYAALPQSFGNAFATLHNADLSDYEAILSEDMQNIVSYLNQKVEDTTAQEGNTSRRDTQSRTFRSPTTNLSFGDLLTQVRLFQQIKLNGILGLIYLNGLSRDRAAAMAKMDYRLQILDDQSDKAEEEEKMVHDLLTEAQKRAQSYVLGIRSETVQPRADVPVIDRGLIDSLVANDSYNFLVRQALDIGYKARELQAERDDLLERKKHMQSFLQGKTVDQSSLIAEAEKSLAELEPAYQQLIADIRKTNADFVRQQFADAIRPVSEIKTEGTVKPLAVSGAIGFALGLATGMGFSLLGIYLGARSKANPA